MSTILLAEDEVMLRVVETEALQDAGFQVLSAGDGEEALALLRTAPKIDLIISDVRMPHGDGVTFAKASLDLNPSAKILLITGYAHDVPPELRRQVVAVLPKPFNLDRLCQIAGELVN